MKALLKYNRQSPRKVRLVADLIRGKSVEDALSVLKFTPKRAASSIEKVLLSAVANAKENEGKREEDLFIKSITIDKGFTMKRRIPKWRGTSDPIRKHTSHMSIVLGERKSRTGTQSTTKETG